jgi:glycosyltransferase involved in cell wall biosynthesis
MKPPVLFVISQAGPLANGGLKSVGEVMLHLKTHRPIVLTNVDSCMSNSWRKAGIDVHVLPEKASAGARSDPLGTLRSYREYYEGVEQILAKSGARVVHANDPLAFQLSFIAAKRARAAIALNLRDTIDPDRKPPRLRFKLIFGIADHVFYLSNDMAVRWREIAPNSQTKSSVTYSIVDSMLFAASPPSKATPPVVLVPGVFRAKKGQLEFIRKVLPKLAERNIQTWFAGDFDPSMDPYAALCAAAAAPCAAHVRFLGYRTDLPDVYREATVVAVCSRYEGLMRGMIEAMSCGRPVVSFDVCSAREMLEDEAGAAGAVVRSGNYQGMADELIRFATDFKFRASAGAAGSNLAHKLFDADRVTERYERVYRELGSGK